MKKWLCLSGAIATEVSGSLALKAALHLPALYLVVAASYTAAFLLLSGGLRNGLPLGVAYGIWGATGVALTALLSSILFHEPVTLLMGVGIVIVMAGVLFVDLGAPAPEGSTAEADQ
ncbi:MAG: DMT family transporter [Actinomycetales bacterium]|jgi:small multidrug resistance pump|nr:SMR family transporter [Leifsonia sp.]